MLLLRIKRKEGEKECKGVRRRFMSRYNEGIHALHDFIVAKQNFLVLAPLFATSFSVLVVVQVRTRVEQRPEEVLLPGLALTRVRREQTSFRNKLPEVVFEFDVARLDPPEVWDRQLVRQARNDSANRDNRGLRAWL